MNFYTCIAIIAVCAAIPFILESIAKLIIASRACGVSDGLAVMVIEHRCDCDDDEDDDEDDEESGDC